MAERCFGEDLALGAVCVMRALTTNMDWARLKVYGEQRQPIIHIHHVRRESDKMWGTGGQMDIAALRKVFAKFMVCADNYSRRV